MSLMKFKSTNPDRQRGFTLVEAMVAVLILAVGMIGLAYLQATGMRLNTTSYQRTQAAVLAGDLLDRMRSHGVTAVAALPDFTVDKQTDTDGCNPLSTDLDNELICWARDIQNSLPQPDVDVSVDSGWVSIDMVWQEPVLRDETPDDDTDNTSPQQLSFEAELMDAPL